MTTRDTSDNDARRVISALAAAVLCGVLVLSGCGENNDLKIDQAKIALANEKPDRAIILADSVLANDPGNEQALLVSAQAQVALDRLGPAKLTLDRLARRMAENPELSRAYLGWSVSTINTVLDNPAFSITDTDRDAFDDARAVAATHLAVLQAQPEAKVQATFIEAQLAHGDLRHARILIKHTGRMIDELGADALVEQPAVGESVPDEDAAGTTYAGQLDALKQVESDSMERLLTLLELVLEAAPGHQEAAVLFMRTAAAEQRWDRLVAQAERFTKVSDLPVPIAERTVSMLLGVPEETAPLADRLALGDAVLRATPADQSGSEGRLISAARLMLAGEQIDKALPILAKLIEDGTTDADAFVLYSHALYESGDYEKCRQIVEQMIPAMSEVSGVQTLYGLTLWRLGELTQARAALREACRLDPANKLAVDAFASLMAQQGMLGASGEDVDAFYELDPTNPRAIQFKLQHAAASGDTQQAVAMVEELERRSEHTASELALLYSANTMLGRHNAAETWARELIAAQPDNEDAWMRLAAAQLRQEDEAGLQETFAQIGGRFPDAPGPAQLTGEIYLQTQQYERAVAALGLAIEEDPDNLPARIALARALAAMGRFNSALEEVRLVLEADPGNVQGLALGARIAGTRGDGELADEYLGKIDPEQIDADRDPALLAQVRKSRGELDEAEAICTRAIATGDASPLLRLVLAEVYQAKGEPARAEEHLVALVRHFPNSAEAYAWLGQFYASSGETEQGIQKLKGVEVYNETLAVLAQAALLRAAERLDDAVLTLDPLLDRLISRRDPMAQTVAEAIAQLHEQSGDTLAAEAVYDRLYNQQAAGTSQLLGDIFATWDTDTPARRLANLDAAAARVQADDTNTLIELSRRYAMLGKPEQSLTVVQRGLSAEPDNEALLGVKAGVLVVMGRTGEAVDTYRRTLALAPEDSLLRVRYARALSADGRRPEAEDELLLLIREGGEASLAARAAVIEMYLGLGLTERAASAVDAVLDRLPVGEEPVLDLAIGRVLMLKDRHAEAQHRLASVVDDSPYFVAARVAHARSRAASGDPASARAEITELVADPGFSRRALPILLGLNPRDTDDRALLISADEAADMDAMPYDLAQRWLAMRLRLADLGGTWQRAAEALDRIAVLNGDDAVAALQVVLLYRAGDATGAAQRLRQSPSLEGSATGSLLAFALDAEAPPAGRVHPMTQILEALAAGDRDTLGSVAADYHGLRTLFADDLLAASTDGEPAGEARRAVLRDLAMATVAMESRMPGLAEALSERALDRVPGYVPAFALLAASRIELGREPGPLAEQARQTAPDSSLSRMLTALSDTTGGDHAGALAPLAELADRHPGDPYLKYQLAQAHGAAGRADEAAALYRPIASTAGPYQLAAKNDLAYLLAKQGGASLDEAVALARDVLRALPSSPAVLDTVGWIEHQRGRDEAALSLLARSITALPEVPEAHYHLGAVYLALGQDRWARYHLQQAATGDAQEKGVSDAEALLAEVADPIGWP